MKLYILRPIENISPNPWNPWYDKAFGFVVCANTHEEARQLASEEAGDEEEYEWNEAYTKKINVRNPWLNPLQSTCIELRPTKKEVIMKDFAAA